MITAVLSLRQSPADRSAARRATCGRNPPCDAVDEQRLPDGGAPVVGVLMSRSHSTTRLLPESATASRSTAPVEPLRPAERIRGNLIPNSHRLPTRFSLLPVRDTRACPRVRNHAGAVHDCGSIGDRQFRVGRQAMAYRAQAADLRNGNSGSGREIRLENGIRQGGPQSGGCPNRRDPMIAGIAISTPPVLVAAKRMRAETDRRPHRPGSLRAPASGCPRTTSAAWPGYSAMPDEHFDDCPVSAT